MKLQIEAMRGTWRGQIGHRTEFADTLEDLLYTLAPDAPEDYLWHAAEVLGGILGAQSVEVPLLPPAPEHRYTLSEPDFQAIADAVFGAQDSPEHWEPTEAQSAYFQPDERNDGE